MTEWKYCTAIVCAIMLLIFLISSYFVYGQHTIRQAKASDSGIWMLADIEAWLMGETSANPDIDMDKYRLRIRKHILHLPAAEPPKTLPEVDKLPVSDFVVFARVLLCSWPIHEFSRDIEEENETNLPVFSQ